MLMQLTLSFSFIFTLFVIFLEKKFTIFTDTTFKEHAVHKIPTPKCGGIAIFFSFLIFCFLYTPTGLYISLAGIPIFLYGLYEDFKGNTPQIVRLSVMAISTFIAIFLTHFYVDDIGLFKLPYFIAVIFTVFAVVGVSSAINFIDGLNGLATGVCLITLGFYAIIFNSYHDLSSLNIVLILIYSIFGFFILNFPWGKIFLGDAGAYFLGYIMAFISIMLVNRHPDISPWYPLIALSYPIIETLVTIKRRIYKKKNKNIPFFKSEKVHLHTLLFKRKTRRNPVASLYLLMFHLCINVVAFCFKENMLVLIVSFVFISIIYLKWYSTMFIKTLNENAKN